MAICIAFLGVGVVAIPTGIISAGFVEQYTKKSRSDKKLQDVAEIGELLVSEGSSFCDKTIGEIQEEDDLRVYVILRDGLTIVAANDIAVKIGDILIVSSDRLQKRAGFQANSGSER